MIFQLEEGIMTCHLAMSGYWDLGDDPWTFDYVEGKRTATERDVRVRIGLTEGKILRFHDSRLFGSLRYYLGCKDVNSLTSIKKMGPEVIQTPRLLPGSHIITREEVEAILGSIKKGISIKEFLMDQRYMAGLGNIYATEVLHSLRCHPLTSAKSLFHLSVELKNESSYAMSLAIDRNLDYQNLRCYRRSKCLLDDTDIQKVKIKGRSSYFCPKCQPS